MAMMTAAPAIGPNTVPMPPTSVISTTSPDIGQLHVGQRGELEHDRLRRPGKAGERRREHEHGELVLGGAVAERDGARLVVPDRLQHLTEGGMDDAVDEQEAGEEDRRHDVVEHAVVGEARAARRACRAAPPGCRPRRR